MIKYAIIENEEYALDNLVSYMHELRPDYQEVFKCDTVEDTVRWLKSDPKVDLIFMDIELNDGICFEIFEQIEVLIPIVFTTAYDSYLMKAFEANSLGYLLKPITIGQLGKILDKYERIKTPNDTKKILDIGRSLKGNNRLLLNQGDEYFYLNISDVAMFVSEDKYVFAITKSGKRHILGFSSLKALAERLDHNNFFLVSRGCIVNIDAITMVKKFFANKLRITIRLGNEETSQTISAGRRRDFLNWFGNTLDT